MRWSSHVEMMGKNEIQDRTHTRILLHTEGARGKLSIKWKGVLEYLKGSGWETKRLDCARTVERSK